MYMNSPVKNPRITGAYGTVNKLWPKGHGGLDFVSSIGNLNIYAVCDAVVTDVILASAGSSYGHHIKAKAVSDPKVTIIYAHLVENSAKFKKGDNIRLGQVIGTMGATGHVTGVHLHLEVRKDNIKTNPCNYLGISNTTGITNIDVGISDVPKTPTPVVKVEPNISDIIASFSKHHKAGEKIELCNVYIYAASDSKAPIRTLSGPYYLYDTVVVNGRYKICPKANVGKLPVGKNVTGWVSI